jgi:penicillin-binding protein 2
LVNRASDGVYPPGSTLKPFIAIAGLEENVRTPEWSMWDPGFFSLPGSQYKFRDWKKGGHGEVNLHKAIVESVDTYFYKLAHELEIEKIHKYLDQFGFGSKTGIDLPREATGIAPSKEWKRRRFGIPWYPGDTISVGIGQGYNLVTPLQLAVATAALANGHALVQPVLSRSGIHPPSMSILDGPPLTPSQPLMLSKKHIRVLQKAMEDVMKPGGTAAGAGRGAAYPIAGKTGTAQVFSLRGAEYDEESLAKKLQDHALFIGYAPAHQPTIALAVVVENGGGGGSVAAPIARKVFDAYFDPRP